MRRRAPAGWESGRGRGPVPDECAGLPKTIPRRCSLQSRPSEVARFAAIRAQRAPRKSRLEPLEQKSSSQITQDLAGGLRGGPDRRKRGVQDRRRVDRSESLEDRESSFTPPSEHITIFGQCVRGAALQRGDIGSIVALWRVIAGPSAWVAPSEARSLRAASKSPVHNAARALRGHPARGLRRHTCRAGCLRFHR